MGSDTVFIEDLTPLTQVTSFKYIRLILTAADNEWTAVVSNLRKARQEWERLTRVLGREGGRIPGPLARYTWLWSSR